MKNKLSNSSNNFKLADLDEPISPCTPDMGGVQVIAVGIVFLALVPGVVDLETSTKNN